jgi:hypothetical protein
MSASGFAGPTSGQSGSVKGFGNGRERCGMTASVNSDLVQDFDLLTFPTRSEWLRDCLAFFWDGKELRNLDS